MATALRWSLLALLAFAVVAVCSGRDLLALCGLDVAALVESREAAMRFEHRKESLARRRIIARDRAHAKQLIILDLLAERLSLLQAGRRFKDLNETPVTYPDDYRTVFPGRTDGEKVCRQVLSWISGELHDLHHDHPDAILQRFEEELNRHMEQHSGLVVLPE
jgi:hypothetical protein